MTPQKAKTIIRAEFSRLGLNNKMTARRVGRDADCIFVIVKNWKPSPEKGHNLRCIAHNNGFCLDFEDKYGCHISA